MVEKMKKSLVAAIIVLMLLPTQLLQVFAVSEGDNPYLKRGSLGDYTVQFDAGGYWVYISYNIVTYTDSDGVERVAYCVTPDTPGIEWTNGSVEGYNVNITQVLQNDELWRVMRHGYPYATPAQMGVETEQDAYLATKLAIQCILLGRPTNQIRTYYRGGQDPVAGLRLADITRRGNKVVDAIYNLVNNARTSNETPTNNTILTATKVGDIKDEGANFTQEYSVTSSTTMKSYRIRNITGFPSGSFTADLSGNAKQLFNNGENFKVVMPKNSTTGTIDGEIEIAANCETYSIFYGEGPSGFQNYALYPDPYRDLNKVVTTNIVPNTAKLTIEKFDKDTGENLAGVTFNARYENGQNIGNFTTDTNGKIEIKNLMKGTVILKETKTQNSYKLSTEEYKVPLEIGESKTIGIENEKKKGKIAVIKVDKDNNEVKLEGVEFQVLNSKGDVVQTLKTDKNGMATTKDLPIDEQYKVKETKTKQEYVLTDEVATVTLKENEITGIQFENEKKKGQIKVIKVDKDFNEVKLEGVKFQVLNHDGRVVEELTTDKNGEAITSRLPIDETYSVKEVSTQKTYILSDKVEKVTLTQDEIKTLTFENEKKTGNIQVYKVDKDNKKIGIGNVEFDLYSDEFNKVIGTYRTDVNGLIKINDLRVGTYKLIEKNTNKWYNLAGETPVEVEWKKTSNVTVENELKKGQIKVIKVDKDNNEVKLAGVTFNVMDEKGNILESITTNEEGEATTHKYAVRDFEKLILKEVETQKEYVLTDKTQTIELKEDEITSIKFENEKIKGYVEITKVDSKTKEKLEGAKFGIYNEKDEQVGELVTDKDGKAKSDLLVCGKYYLKELDTGSPYYLLNEDTFKFEIVENHKTVPVEIENDEVEIKVNVDKKGTVEIKPGEEVNYEFSNVANESNIYLENFEWIDYIPTDYVRLQTMTTGTWNQELTYNVYYKTNKSENYILRYNDLTTTENHLLDFTDVELDEDEYITETCFGFGEVQKGFKEDEKPTMTCKSFDTLEDGQTFTNKTKTVGTYFNLKAEANSKWTTIVHKPVEKHEEILPRTGK